MSRRLHPTARIAIVDDEPMSRMLLRTFLHREAYQLFEARSGQELLDHIGEWQPDVILLDVLMPDMDGYAVCRKLRAHRRWRHIPVILVTALDRHEEVVKGLHAGADEFLTKPVSGSELIARVQTMLRIKRQYDDLQAALTLRNELVDVLVHDMRNSLSVATLKAQRILRERDPDAADADSLATIVEHVNRLNLFLNNFSLIMQLETGDRVPDVIARDIVPFVMGIVDIHRPTADRNAQYLLIKTPDVELRTAIDVNLLDKVLHNLLSNALRYAPHHGTVCVRLASASIPAPIHGKGAADGAALEKEPLAERKPELPAVRIQVSDDGPGVADADKTHIFHHFTFRRSIAYADEPHNGLGLVFSRLVVEAHGGRIWVEDNQPTGALFQVELPRLDPPASASHPPAQTS